MIGLAVAFLTEGFQLAAQIFGVQAGYGFASTIDPTSQADSGVLQVILTLVTGLLFFTTGIDRQLIRVLAASFQTFPAGAWAPSIATPRRSGAPGRRHFRRSGCAWRCR